MSDEPLRELEGQVRRQLEVATELHDFLREYVRGDLASTGRTVTAGLVVAGLLENYYTAIETTLFRVVQEFGNHLDRDRWHADILDRLAVEVPEVRPRVLSEESYRRLDELRRFRHFKRYYYRIDYDWDKLDFLLRKEAELQPLLVDDLERFLEFLRSL